MTQVEYPKRDDLYRFLLSQIDVPFEWGVNDCTIFGLRCLDVLTGENHAQKFLRKWNNRSTAYRYSRVCGFTFESYLKSVGCVDVYGEPLVLGDFILMEQIINNRKLWKRPAVYAGRNFAVAVAHDYGRTMLLRLEELPEYNTVLRVV